MKQYMDRDFAYDFINKKPFDGMMSFFKISLENWNEFYVELKLMKTFYFLIHKNYKVNYKIWSQHTTVGLN